MKNLKIGPPIALLLLVLAVSCSVAHVLSNRVVYQVLTDRFCRSDNSLDPCADLDLYCGGTWKGLTNQLDYIRGMGFSAIWISPIVENTKGGYHGYWAKNLSALNAHFGSDGDLLALSEACSKRDIMLIVDVVTNHMGYEKFSLLFPFNSSSHYHRNCNISDFTCFTPMIQNCRLDGLPDLNQSVPFVRSQLLQYVSRIVERYNFSSVRLDTTPEQPLSFTDALPGAVGNNRFIFGEVFSSDCSCLAAYQKSLQGGVLSYPLFFSLVSSFAREQSMQQVAQVFSQYQHASLDVDRTLAFVNNHDNPPFSSIRADRVAFVNSLCAVLFSPGVPIFYQGDELFPSLNASSSNPRIPIWQQSSQPYTPSLAPLYHLIQSLITFRNTLQNNNNLSSYPMNVIVASNFALIFSRGPLLVALTNAGSNAGLSEPISIATSSWLPHAPPKDAKVCEFFTQMCQTLNQPTFTITFLNGRAQIYTLQQQQQKD